MNLKLSLAVALSLALGACEDASGPEDSLTAQDEADIEAALDASGLAEEDFGELGLAADFSVSSGAFTFGFPAAFAADTIRLPRFWGRRREQPVERIRDISVSDNRDTALVTFTVRFDGTFMMRTQPGDSTSPGQGKPLREEMIQRALAVRVPADSATDSTRWRVVALSGQEFQDVDPARRTVAITRVLMTVNGAVRADVTDPRALFRISNQVARLELGDSVLVTAEVSNTTGGDNEPPTFVFLHVLDANPDRRSWRRLPMTPGTGGTFTRSWVVRQTGRARLAVDALDSGTFETPTGDTYRASIWAVPYRIE